MGKLSLGCGSRHAPILCGEEHRIGTELLYGFRWDSLADKRLLRLVHDVGRVDHRFSPADSAYLRFNFDASYSDVPLIEGGTYLNDRQLVTSRPVNGELESLHIFSTRLVNEVKFGFKRGNVYTTDQSELQTPYTISISGFTTLSGDEYKLGVGNTFSYIDNLTRVKASHTLKVGVEVRRVQFNQENAANGTISFSSAASFLKNSVNAASYAAQLPVNGLRKTELYSYVRTNGRCVPI